MSARAAAKDGLQELAGLYGVETSYTDGLDRPCEPPAEALVAVLRSLGAPIDSAANVPNAIREREAEMSKRLIEPVIVAWGGSLGTAQLPGAVPWRITLEDGTARESRDGSPPATLPFGYHRLHVDDGSSTHESLIISAPEKAYAPPVTLRDWGVFAPLYGLRSDNSWGTGDFGDLRRLLDWTASLGGSVVATLPLLAAFTGRPTSISPYSPASRFFWNEMYIDVSAVPELADSDEARDIVSSPAFQKEIRRLNEHPVVDYEAVTALKRQVLDPLARSLGPARRAELDAFVKDNPSLADYARFRAATERQASGWRGWPERQRSGALSAGDYDADVAQYHTYVQWLAHEQLTSLASGDGAQLYFDMPLGVHADSYDAWSKRDCFANGVATGAPPDAVFTTGQNWAFAPPHPERARRSGYRYFIDCLRTLMRHAAFLRIDHILGLHRLFWIPDGMDGSDGVYVRYPADELYAILTLESHRNQTVIIGEDLGNVPPYVRPKMAMHGILSSYVLPFELAAGKAPAPPKFGQVASLDTHDMQPFAAFWDDKANEPQRAALETVLAGGAPSHTAANRWLAESDAAIVLVNLEDLWQETERQNVPGTTESERPNWRRKLRHSLEEIQEMPAVTDSLATVHAAREPTEVAS